VDIQESRNIANIVTDRATQFTMEIIQKQLETAKATLAEDSETTRIHIIYGFCVRTLGLEYGEELRSGKLSEGMQPNWH
jgi:hypothetical protein